MPFVHENVKVELFPGTPSPIVYLSENDVGDTIVFELVYKGQPVNIPSGSIFKFKGTKKDGLGFTVNSSNVSGNVVSFVVSQDMTSCSGVVEAEISITLSNNKHGTCNVVLIVEKNPHSDGIQDGSYPQIISEMMALVNQIEGDAATASNAANIAVAAKNSALEIQQDVHQHTASVINDWLDDHPEATTTVQDGAIEKVKLATSLKPLVLNYVDPMDYGAVGDGETNDSEAVRLASLDGIIKNTENVFLIGTSINISNGMKDTTFKLAWDKTINVNAEYAVIDGCDFSQDELVIEESNRGGWLLNVSKSNVSVINCKFHDAPNCLAIGTNISNVEVRNNRFVDIPTTTFSLGNGYGILLQNATKNISITNNIFTNVERHCIYITQDYWNTYPVVATNIHITGNRFVFEDGVTQINAQQGAIAIRGAKNIFIDDNYFYGYTTAWFYNCTMRGFENVYTRNNVIEHMGYNGNINYAMTTFYFVGAETEDYSDIKNIVISGNIVRDSAVGFINIGYGDYTIIGNDVELVLDDVLRILLFIVRVSANNPNRAKLILKGNSFRYKNLNAIQNTSFITLYAVKETTPSAKFDYIDISENIFTGGQLFFASAGDSTYGMEVDMLKISNNIFNLEKTSCVVRVNVSKFYTIGNLVFVNGEKGTHEIGGAQFEDTFLNDDSIIVYINNIQRKYAGNLIINDSNNFVPLAIHASKINGVQFTNGVAEFSIAGNVYNRMAIASIAGSTNRTFSINIIRGGNQTITIELTDHTFTGTLDVCIVYLTQR